MSNSTVQTEPHVSSLSFSVPQKILEKALSFANSIVSKKALMPVLSHLKIKVDDVIAFTATDMDLVIKETFQCDIGQKGEICVLSSLFYDIVKKTGKDERIQCTLLDNVLWIKTTKSEFRIPTLDATSFADISEMPFDNVFTLKAKDLLDLLNQVYFCMSIDEARYNLNGVYLHQNDAQQLTCVATDMHRLAMTSSASVEASFEPCIIGKKTVYELRRILEDSDGDVKVHVSKSRIQFEVENQGVFVTMSARLIDGVFPNYQKIVVKNHDNKAKISRDFLEAALERISLVLPEDERYVRFHFQKNQLLLKARSQSLGAAEEYMQIQYEGPDLNIVFNINYILDIAHHVKEETLSFLMKGNYDSVVIETLKSHYFIMPLVM